jgi:hypothetical protein
MTRGAPARREALLAVAAGLGLALVAAAYYRLSGAGLPPEQPIPFSHRVHATVKKISCIYCHPGVLDSARAGVPPLATCIHCHDRIIIHHPEIAKLRAHYDRRDPVPWVRVHALPEFVYFAHAPHIHAGVDCGHCHGDVAQMDRIELAHDLVMGFCVQCHRDNDVSHDCLICHR